MSLTSLSSVRAGPFFCVTTCDIAPSNIYSLLAGEPRALCIPSELPCSMRLPLSHHVHFFQLTAVGAQGLATAYVNMFYHGPFEGMVAYINCGRLSA